MPLGRTNEDFAPFWIAPRLGKTPTEMDRLAGAVRAHELPVDVSSSPAFWGSALRGQRHPIMVRLGRKLEFSSDANHATDLVQAELIERLSSLGRLQIDIVGLVLERPLEEYQLDGALRALELARQEGHFRFLALVARGPAITVQSMWQFHDAFELLVAPDGEETQSLERIAATRRVGLVTELPTVDWTPSPRTVMLPIERSEQLEVPVGR